MKTRAIYYDTETTGIQAGTDRIVEIAAFDATLNKEFCSLVNPGIAIPEEAKAVHGISDEMVKDAPSWKEVGARFSAFCGDDCILIAHNNDGFDIFFLQEEFKRHGMEMPQWRFIDTLKWARRYRKDLPRHGLQSLREIYGIAPNNAHRALDDVMVLKEVFSKMIDDLPIETVYTLMKEAKK